MKSRILKKGSFFTIGEIEFKVAAILPGFKGIVNSKTYLKCNDYYSSKNVIKRALVISTEKYENFSENIMLEELMNKNANLLINKNDILQLKEKEFFVRNCEPETGRLDSNTQITIENREISDLLKLKIAIINVNKKFIKFLFIFLL